jgi:hypothetical protein
MKIETKKQLLIMLVLVNLVVFSVIGAVLWYYDGIRGLGPLFGAAAAVTAVQYNLRKKQLPEAE